MQKIEVKGLWRMLMVYGNISAKNGIHVLKILVWISSISIYISINTILMISLLGLE